MQTHSWMVFYQGEFCRGEYIMVHQSTNRINPSKEMWHNAITPLLRDYGVARHNISSFMAWESGWRPTRGFVDVCLDESARFIRNVFSLGVAGSTAEEKS